MAPVHQLLDSWISFMKVCTCSMATESISAVHLSKFLQCLGVYVSFLSVLGNGSVNTLPGQRMHVTLEELLGVSFSVRSMLYLRKSGYWFFPELYIFLVTKKHVMQHCQRDDMYHQVVESSRDLDSSHVLVNTTLYLTFSFRASAHGLSLLL
jgi:hypothetical protein